MTSSRYKERPCPGCGAMYSHDGTRLCGTCVKDIERGKSARLAEQEALTAGQTVPFAIGRGLMHNLPKDRYIDWKVEQAAYEALAVVIEPAPLEFWSTKTIKMLYPGHDDWHGCIRGAISPRKFDALTIFLEWFRAELGAHYAQGFADGRSWLNQLANGDLTVNQINATDEKFKGSK